MYGNQQRTSINNNQNVEVFSKISYKMDKPKFDDDDIIISQQQQLNPQKVYDIVKSLHLDVRSKCKNVQLGTIESHQPVMITLRTDDQEEEQPNLVQGQNYPSNQELQQSAKSFDQVAQSSINRSQGVDLICVIDHSGSMRGIKMGLVRDTLNYLVDQLSEIDRLCLIQFDDNSDRLTPFITLNPENKKKVKQVISQLSDKGGTDINLGMNCAFECLTQRKSINVVSSIFLLSDGLDPGAQIKVQQSFFNKFQNLVEATFTIHSFGFGQDHDPKLMSQIASLKDGNFYFIQDLAKLDESFIDALGALFSVVAQDIKLTVEVMQDHPFIKPNYSKTYGDMWVEKTKFIQQISISQLMSGVSKDFLMELLIPAYTEKISDADRNIEVIKVFLTGLDGNKQSFSKQKNLMLTLFSQDEQMGEVEEDGEVMENYCRVQAALAMKEALIEGNKGNYEQGQKLVDIAMQKIEICKLNKKVNVDNINSLQKDLQQTKEQCNRQSFNQYGKHNMIMMNKCHMEQRSHGFQQQQLQGVQQAQYQYSNKAQMQMQQNLQVQKQSISQPAQVKEQKMEEEF